jgi:aspartate aminotransferase-like enzyme
MAVPEGANSTEIIKVIKKRFAAAPTDGQGEMAGKMVRIAHLGFFDYMDTIAFIAAMEHIARDTMKLDIEFGSGVAAAQKVYAGKLA